jgi:DNA-nicking Smr family endonuclease
LAAQAICIRLRPLESTLSRNAGCVASSRRTVATSMLRTASSRRVFDMRPQHNAGMAPGDDQDDALAPIEIPIDGTLDLHTVRPAEARALVAAYLDECAARGIFEVRIVHGKGTGTMRRQVASELARHPLVASFRTADEAAGGWGATLVELRRG